MTFCWLSESRSITVCRKSSKSDSRPTQPLGTQRHKTIYLSSIKSTKAPDKIQIQKWSIKWAKAGNRWWRRNTEPLSDYVQRRLGKPEPPGVDPGKYVTAAVKRRNRWKELLTKEYWKKASVTLKPLVTILEGHGNQAKLLRTWQSNTQEGQRGGLIPLHHDEDLRLLIFIIYFTVYFINYFTMLTTFLRWLVPFRVSISTLRTLDKEMRFFKEMLPECLKA